MKQKTQGRELSALVPASFVFSDYDEQKKNSEKDEGCTS